MPDSAIVGKNISAAQLTSPDNVIPGIYRQLYLEPVALGLYLHHRRAFPGCPGPAIILGYHKGAMGQLVSPVGHQDGIERLRLADIFPLDHYHKISDRRTVYPHFRFRGGSEVLNRTYLDEKLRRVYRTDADDPEKRRVYVVSPEQTVFADDKYYLFCHDDKHGDVVQYRVDRMSNVSMIDEDKTPAKEAADFDLSKHKLQLFGMFGGKEAAVKIKADRSLLDVVIDKFGGGSEDCSELCL